MNHHETGNFLPSPNHNFTPSVIIFCGSLSKEAISLLGDGVRTRLGTSISSEAFLQDHLKSLSDISEERIRRLIAPFFRFEFRTAMAERGYSQAREEGELTTAKIIVVCDRAANDPSTVSQLLQSLATVIQSALANVRYELTLIVLGSGTLDLGKSKHAYWPRFRLQEEALDGVKASQDIVLGACQNLLVALTGSELVSALNWSIADKESVDWIWTGVSALAVDLDNMREFLQEAVLERLLLPLIMTNWNENGKRLVDEAVAEKIEDMQSALLSSAIQDTTPYSWQGKTEKRNVIRFEIDRGSELAPKVFRPEKDLAPALSANYEQLAEALTQNLGKETSQQYAHLLDVLAFFLDRSTSRNKDRSTPLTLIEQWPSGLVVAVYALGKMIAKLKGSMDARCNGKDVPPFPIRTRRFLMSVGESDASAVYSTMRRLVRLERTILSYLGTVLKLIPAWPLVTGILIVIFSLETVTAALAAATLLIVVGIIEQAIWRYIVQRQRRKLERENEQRVSGSALRIVARVLQDYRLLVIARLIDIFHTLQRLMELVFDLVKKTADSRAKRTTARKGDSGTVYWLADYARCLAWSDQAIKQANETSSPYENVTTMLIAQHVFPLLEQLESPQAVLQKIQSIAHKYAQENFRSDVLEPYVLAGQEKPLQSGKQWEWLYKRAHPLGQTGKKVEALTVIALASDAALIGASGRSSEYWSDEWIVARSSLGHETLCFRGLVEFNQ